MLNNIRSFGMEWNGEESHALPIGSHEIGFDLTH